MRTSGQCLQTTKPENVVREIQEVTSGILVVMSLRFGQTKAT